MKVPRIAGPYVTIYQAAADRFPGPDTVELKAGQLYEEWVPNDHAFIQGPDKRWHLFGITHPLTSPERVHEGEFQSFHALAPAGPLNAALREHAWQDLPKVLSATERPGENPAFYAPYLVRKEKLYYPTFPF